MNLIKVYGYSEIESGSRDSFCVTSGNTLWPPMFVCALRENTNIVVEILPAGWLLKWTDEEKDGEMERLSVEASELQWTKVVSNRLSKGNSR